MTGPVEPFLAKLCELVIKLSANQLLIFGSSGRRSVVGNTTANATATSLKIEVAVVLASSCVSGCVSGCVQLFVPTYLIWVIN